MPVSFRTELHLTCDGRLCDPCMFHMQEGIFDDVDAHPRKPTCARLKSVAKKSGWVFIENRVYCNGCAILLTSKDLKE